MTTHHSRFLPLTALLLGLASGGCFNSGQSVGNSFGTTTQFELVGMDWGRLVDVTDVNDELVGTDVLISDSLAIDGLNYEMSVNPVTELDTLKILQPKGTSAFQALLTAAKANIASVDPKGPNDPPDYTLVPRNAAIRLRFTQPVDPSTVNASSIQVFSGDPEVDQFTVRYVVQNDLAANTGAVIVDPTISARQSADLNLPPNPVGFPVSLDAVNDNLKLRIPTKEDLLFGQATVLKSLGSGRRIHPVNGEPTETSPGGDPVLVRVLRTGNEQDPFNGFLEDLVRPRLIGVQDVTVDSIAAPLGSAAPDRQLTYSVNAVYCQALTPKPGDVFEFTGSVFLVSRVLDSGNPLALVVEGKILDGDPATNLLPGGPGLAVSGRLNTAYTAADSSIQVCYVSILPKPVYTPGQPLAVDPLTTTLTITFSEAIDPLTVTSMGTFVLTAFEQTTGFGDETLYFRHPTFGTETVAHYIDRQRGYDLRVDSGGTSSASEFGGRLLFGPVEPDSGGRSFTLTPSGGFSDPNGDPFLQFAVAVRNGPDGIRDLAGNPVDFTGFVAGTPLPGVPPEAQIGVSGTPPASKYFSLRGLGVDENNDGLAEYSGNLGYTPGELTGRPATHFSLDADNSNSFISAQAQIPSPLIPNAVPPHAPLSPAGAVVMTVFRPHDLGLGLDGLGMGLGYRNPAEFDLDVVGMSWTPLGGVVIDDTFPEISLALAHSKFMPDEVINTLSQRPIFPNSGLLRSGTFDDNILGFPQYDEKIVFDTSYTMRKIHLFTTSSGNSMLAWPDFSDSYTWRDTAIPPTVLGGANSNDSIGSPPALHPDAGLFPPSQVPSIGLPLLARFRCFPRAQELGVNSFQVTQMVTASSLPAFRIFSEGGQDASGQWFQVIPDNAAAGGTSPSGGFNSAGARTDAFDPFVYWSEIDFVTRVSRVFTHWFDMGTNLIAGGTAGVVLEPDNPSQLPGTSVIVEFRGAAQVDHNGNPTINPSPLTDASANFDFFGEYQLNGVSTPSTWTTNFADLEDRGYRYFQIRLTFVNNPTQETQSVMDGLGIAWTQ